jgi:hypothetical protein
MTDGLLTPEKPQEQQPGGLEQSSSEISSVEADEAAFEHSAERLDDILHAEAAPKTQLQVKRTVQQTDDLSQQQMSQKDPIVIEVEKILEDGVGSFYSALSDDAKLAFKKKGEETAFEISEMVRTLHVKFKRLIYLISDWLKTIPGVNRFFLEQEAKIKADRIMQLVEARKQDQEKKV